MKAWLLSAAHWIALSICLISVISFWSAEPARVEMTTPEVYDATLQRVQTIDQVLVEVSKMPADDVAGRVLNLEKFLRARFYGGYVRYSFHENWVAWLASRTVHPHLDAKTIASEIMRSPWAACSQQAIVVQEILRRMKLNYASVLFPNHFTAAVRIDRIWYVVDPWEPMDRDHSRLIALTEWQSANGRAQFLRPATQAVWEPRLMRRPPQLAHVNQYPAPTMAWFHPLSQMLSNWLWVPALLWLLFWVRAAMANRKQARGQVRREGRFRPDSRGGRRHPRSVRTVR